MRRLVRTALMSAGIAAIVAVPISLIGATMASHHPPEYSGCPLGMLPCNSPPSGTYWLVCSSDSNWYIFYSGQSEPATRHYLAEQGIALPRNAIGPFNADSMLTRPFKYALEHLPLCGSRPHVSQRITQP